ncbi:hypothetical protein [Cellulomonas sp. Marseille-Q8402]
MGRRHDHRSRTTAIDPTIALPVHRTTGRKPRARRAATGSRLGLCVRSAVLGVAAGSRASLALAAPTLADPGSGTVARLGARLGILAELTGDKLPSTPSRLEPPGPQSRAVAAALGGAMLARQRGRNVVVPAATAALFSAAGTWGGAAWRAWAAQRGPDFRGAFAEDAVAITLATLASRRG